MPLPHTYYSPKITKAINAAYDGVPDDIKEDIVSAANWALACLASYEGTGHIIQVSATTKGGEVVCSFAKPSWQGDHCSEPMETGSEAIVLAVCEYLAYGQDNK